jgi:hypothetical protein
MSFRLNSGWQRRGSEELEDDSQSTQPSPATQLADLLCQEYQKMDALKQCLNDLVASVKKLSDLYNAKRLGAGDEDLEVAAHILKIQDTLLTATHLVSEKSLP